MFEQDYVMRMIKEIARVLAKILFHADSETIEEELTEDKETQQTLTNLFDMIDEGLINEAENIVYEISEKGVKTDLQIVLQFYAYLNDKSDLFLEEHNFSREEILSGLTDVTAKYGVKGIAEIFLEYP